MKFSNKNKKKKVKKKKSSFNYFLFKKWFNFNIPYIHFKKKIFNVTISIKMRRKKKGFF